MATKIPTPYVLIPTDIWDGNDGNWTTFRISVGTPRQDFRVLPSTRGSGLWVPVADGCDPDDTEYCSYTRGIEPFLNKTSFGFRSGLSSTWNGTGEPSLSLNENLGYSGSGSSGVDSVLLGPGQDSKLAISQDAAVIGITDKDYHLGLFGLKPATQNTSLPGKVAAGVIEGLKDNGLIPSLSYGYTAGGKYQYNGVPGSLVLGGYDQSRIKPPTISISFREGNLPVAVQSIHATASLVSMSSIRLDEGSGHISVIDTTVPHLWLPGSICDSFAQAFGLDYDSGKGFYLINETMHEKLLRINPSLTFTLGSEISHRDNKSTSIKLPYLALDSWIGYPFYDNPTRYFPIRRATDPSQYAIGRMLLQEAYLIVDHERRNFSLSPIIYSDPLPDPDIRTISPVDPETGSANSAGRSTRVGSIVGITIGAFSILLLIAGTWFLWRRRRKQDKGPELESYHPPGGRHELGTEKMDISKHRPEAGGDGINEMEVPQHEIDGETTAVYELSAELRPVELGHSDSPFERAVDER